MGLERPAMRPQLVRGGRADEPTDARVAAVLEVLAGSPVADVAAGGTVEPALVHRWVRGFVEAGTAQVTNTPTAEAASQRDRFLTAFAHELRTPLAVAQGWVAMLDEGDIPPSMLADTVGRLDDSWPRLAERILDVELLAQASLGRLRLSPRTLTVGELAHGLPGPRCASRARVRRSRSGSTRTCSGGRCATSGRPARCVRHPDHCGSRWPRSRCGSTAHRPGRRSDRTGRASGPF